MSLDFEVSTIATMTVPDSWRLSLEAPRYSTIAPPVGVTRMSRSVSHPLLRSIHPSPSVLSTPQSVERYRRRSASKDSSNAVQCTALRVSGQPGRHGDRRERDGAVLREARRHRTRIQQHP